MADGIASLVGGGAAAAGGFNGSSSSNGNATRGFKRTGALEGVAIIACGSAGSSGSGVGSSSADPVVYFRTWGVSDRLEQSAMIKGLLAKELSLVSESTPSIFSTVQGTTAYACIRRGNRLCCCIQRGNDARQLQSTHSGRSTQLLSRAGACKIFTDALRVLSGKLACASMTFAMVPRLRRPKSAASQVKRQVLCSGEDDGVRPR